MTIPWCSWNPGSCMGSATTWTSTTTPAGGSAQARVLRTGSGATVVAAGQMVPTALAAVDAGLDAEVIDLSTFAPWDVATVSASVARTGMLVTVEANPVQRRLGADVIAEITTRNFADLTAPPLRIAPPDTPVPYAAGLERAYIPDAETVRTQVTALIETRRIAAPWWEGVPA